MRAQNNPGVGGRCLPRRTRDTDRHRDGTCQPQTRPGLPTAKPTWVCSQAPGPRNAASCPPEAAHSHAETSRTVNTHTHTHTLTHSRILYVQHTLHTYAQYTHTLHAYTQYTHTHTHMPWKVRFVYCLDFLTQLFTPDQPCVPRGPRLSPGQGDKQGALPTHDPSTARPRGPSCPAARHQPPQRNRCFQKTHEAPESRTASACYTLR